MHACLVKAGTSWPAHRMASLTARVGTCKSNGHLLRVIDTIQGLIRPPSTSHSSHLALSRAAEVMVSRQVRLPVQAKEFLLVKPP